MAKRTSKSSDRRTSTKTEANAAAPAPAAPMGEAKPPPAPAAKNAKRSPRRSKPAKGGKPARTKRTGMSGLDAAAKVLADAGKAMRCGEIVEKMLGKGLWKTGGKTPAATINAAMLREARDKGKGSRFKKAGRGLFALTEKGR